LTNIAMALVKAWDIAGSIAELVVMGGACFELGNGKIVGFVATLVVPVPASTVLLGTGGWNVPARRRRPV
jgi:inosine-uridine nucleoside N-ribohydrolase